MQAGAITALGRYRALTAPTHPASEIQVYGVDPYARMMRQRDLGRKATLRAAEWALLMRSREQTFGLPPGTLQ